MKPTYDQLDPFLSDWADRISADPAATRLSCPYRVNSPPMPAPGEPWPIIVAMTIDDKPVALTFYGKDEMRFIDWLRTLGPYQTKGGVSDG